MSGNTERTKLLSMTHALAIALGFIISSIWGTGAFWSHKDQKLSEIEAGLRLRDEQAELMLSIIELSERYTKMILSKSHNSETDVVLSVEALNARLKLLKDNFRAVERSLADLEDREPRKIELEFVPPPAPTNLSVSFQ